MKNLPAICIVSHRSLAALRDDTDGHIGGIERQVALIAQWLAKSGFPTSVVVWDEGQADELTINGVKVIKLCREKAGAKGFRFFHPYWTSLNAALKRSGADVYLQLGASHYTGQIALWCRFHGRKFIFSAASDTNVQKNLPGLKSYRERLLYRLGLRKAHQIVTQTGWQKKTLQSELGFESLVVPMPCAGPDEAEYQQREFPGERPAILWVARITKVKRLNWFLDLAGQCPEFTFQVVGPTGDSSESRASAERAGKIENVEFLGAVSRETLISQFANAAVYCCTSSCEGFPNTFLEAWSYGLPIVSTLDVDEIIEKYDLGFVSTDLDDFAKKLRAFLASPGEWLETSRRAREFYCDNHTLDAAMEKLSSVFLAAVEQGETLPAPKESPHSIKAN